MRFSLLGTAALATPAILAIAGESETAPESFPYSPEPLEALIEKFLSKAPGPVLLYDLNGVEANYKSFRTADPDASVFYAVKCAPNPRVIARLVQLGSGFDVASRAEIDLALEAGADPGKCIFSNTVKFPDDVAYAHSHGVKAFLADSMEQVRMQSEKAPGSRLYVRLLVDNKDAAHPLGEKFGTTPENAIELI